MRRGLRWGIVAVVVALVALTGVVLLAQQRTALLQLGNESVAAYEEVRRFEYVLARADELEKLRGAVARRAAGEPGAMPLPRTNPVRDLGAPASAIPRSPLDYSAAIDQRQRWLASAKDLLQRGRDLEAQLPQLEADATAAERALGIPQ